MKEERLHNLLILPTGEHIKIFEDGDVEGVPDGSAYFHRIDLHYRRKFAQLRSPATRVNSSVSGSSHGDAPIDNAINAEGGVK